MFEHQLMLPCIFLTHLSSLFFLSFTYSMLSNESFIRKFHDISCKIYQKMIFFSFSISRKSHQLIYIEVLFVIKCTFIIRHIFDWHFLHCYESNKAVSMATHIKSRYKNHAKERVGNTTEPSFTFSKTVGKE